MNDYILEFRDGKRQVAPHVFEMLKGVETYRMLYEEALNFANGRVFSDYANRKHSEIVARHFREHK